MTRLPFSSLLDDLAVETETLNYLLTNLTTADWELPTPAEGWAIRDQISHLAFFDQAAVTSATDPDRFRAEAAELVALGPGFPDDVAQRYQDTSAAELADWFRGARSDLLAVFSSLDGKSRVPWFGTDMSVTSSATARLMETWAHGQDIADCLGVERAPTGRLRHVAHLGVRTLGFSFALNGLAVPETPVWVDLEAPDGGRWTWGDKTAANSVKGPALDFCLLVTQRRHLASTDLVVSGAVANQWMSIAQAFAGAPGPGREPLVLEQREVS